jgi:hypothetical protein
MEITAVFQTSLMSDEDVVENGVACCLLVARHVNACIMGLLLGSYTSSFTSMTALYMMTQSSRTLNAYMA